MENIEEEFLRVKRNAFEYKIVAWRWARVKAIEAVRKMNLVHPGTEHLLISLLEERGLLALQDEELLIHGIDKNNKNILVKIEFVLPKMVLSDFACFAKIVNNVEVLC